VHTGLPAGTIGGQGIQPAARALSIAPLLDFVEFRLHKILHQAPPYAPEYNPDEYLNHALKISVHSGQLPYTVEDISHKVRSFMRKLQHRPHLLSCFFHYQALSYL